MNRRDAIKRIGALAAGAVISSTGLAGASNLINGNNGNMKILAINGSARKQGPCVWHNLAFATFVRSGFKIYLPAASPAGFIDQSRDYMMCDAFVAEKLTDIYVHKICTSTRRIAGRWKFFGKAYCSAATFHSVVFSYKSQVCVICDMLAIVLPVGNEHTRMRLDTRHIPYNFSAPVHQGRQSRYPF